MPPSGHAGHDAWARWSPRIDLAITLRVSTTASAARLHAGGKLSDDAWAQVAVASNAAKRALDTAVAAVWAYSGDPQGGVAPAEVAAAEGAVRALADLVASLTTGGAP
jgi:hypothetical protein